MREEGAWRLSAWPLVAGGSGALLLLQTSFGAFVELALGEARFGHMLGCIAAATVFVGGVLARHSALLLLVFPATLLAPLSTLSPEAAAAATSPVRWIPWVATLLLYLASASAWLARPTSPTLALRREPVVDAPSHRRGSIFFVARVASAVGLLIVPASVMVIRSPRLHFSSSREPSIAFVHLALVFVWTIALYAFFVAPLLDEERDRLRLGAELAADLGPAGRRRRLLRRGAVAVGIVVAVAILVGGR